MSQKNCVIKICTIIEIKNKVEYFEKLISNILTSSLRIIKIILIFMMRLELFLKVLKLSQFLVEIDAPIKSQVIFFLIAEME